MKYEGRITHMSNTGEQVYILVWLKPRVLFYRGLRRNWSPELEETLKQQDPIGLSVIFEPSRDPKSREGYHVDLNSKDSFDIDEVALSTIEAIQKVVDLQFAQKPIQVESGKYRFSFQYGMKAIDMTVTWKTKPQPAISFITNSIKTMG